MFNKNTWLKISWNFLFKSKVAALFRRSVEKGDPFSLLNNFRIIIIIMVPNEGNSCPFEKRDFTLIDF